MLQFQTFERDDKCHEIVLAMGVSLMSVHELAIRERLRIVMPHHVTTNKYFLFYIPTPCTLVPDVASAQHCIRLALQLRQYAGSRSI